MPKAIHVRVHVYTTCYTLARAYNAQTTVVFITACRDHVTTRLRLRWSYVQTAGSATDASAVPAESSNSIEPSDQRTFPPIPARLTALRPFHDRLQFISSDMSMPLRCLRRKERRLKL